MPCKECLKSGKVCGETLSAGSSLIHGEQNAQSRDRGVARFLLPWFKKVFLFGLQKQAKEKKVRKKQEVILFLTKGVS